MHGYFEMTPLEEFHEALQRLVRERGQDSGVRIEHAPGSGVIRIYGSNATALARSRECLDEVQEFSYHVAEHHPLWGLLYHCVEISRTVLEKWDAEMTDEEIDEIGWSIREISGSYEKIRTDVQAQGQR